MALHATNDAPPPPDGGRVLYQDAWVEVACLPRSNVVRATRSSTPFESAEHAGQVWDAVCEAVASVDKRQHVLLVDLSHAPPRNDPEFEQVISRRRFQLREHFPRVAVLVSTLTGRMQLERHMREDGAPTARVFTLESQALLWLRKSLG